MMNNDRALQLMPPDQRQAILERLGHTLCRDGQKAGYEGNLVLEMIMGSMGSAVVATASDLTYNIELSKRVVARGMQLLVQFHAAYPQYEVGPTLH